MVEKSLNLKNSRVLICNDDGINAPGLNILEKVISELVREVWVVAPETEQSATSHSITLRQPLRIRKVASRRFAVNGTPVDSVLLALVQLMKNNPPDIVISGINRGANLGEDVIYSGTVGAAMEGTLMGLPAIALSQVTTDFSPVKWPTVKKWLPKVLKGLDKFAFPPSVLLNINFPDVSAKKISGIEITRQGHRKIGDDLQFGIDPRGEKYFWIGPKRVEDKLRKGSDLDAINRGFISISPLSTNLSHLRTLKSLKGFF